MKATVSVKKDQKIHKTAPQRSIISIERFVKDNQTDMKAMWKSFKTSMSEIISGARNFSKK